jgi:tellurite resistance protein TerC
MQVSPWVWVLFAVMVLALLAVDLGVFRASRRAPQEVTLRSAAWWSAAWIGLSLVFALVVSVLYGTAPALTYLTAYLLEKSLSVDNIFVFVLIFSDLRIPPTQQRRVLYWGVLGALVVRAGLIAGGVFLLRRFHWVIYPFAALVVFAAVRILWGREKERKLVATACAVCGSWVARIIPITPVPRGGSFWVRERGRLIATPIFIALIVVETTDVIFALDSPRCLRSPGTYFWCTHPMSSRCLGCARSTSCSPASWIAFAFSVPVSRPFSPSSASNCFPVESCRSLRGCRSPSSPPR